MNIATRYFKTTLGIPAEVVIANGWMGDADYATFQSAGSAGEVGCFWDDIDAEAVGQGEALLPENQNRKIFWGWKQADGVAAATSTVYRTTGFPVRDLEMKTLAYNAGTADVYTVAYGGTIPNGQVIYVTIVDKTARAIPYPRWQYSAVVAGGSVNSAVASLAAQINAEKIDPIATASASTTTLTITAKDKRSFIDVTYSLDTTAAQPTDASAIVKTHTAKAVAPVGDFAMVKYLETFLKVMKGDPLYYPEGTLPEDWGAFASNVSASVQYGIGVIRTKKWERGETRNYRDWGNLIIAVPTADIDDITLPITPVPEEPAP